MSFRGLEVNKTIVELRASPYHQQLGRKLCAAFVAHQQGTRIDTALRKIEEPIGDLWLMMAEIARLGAIPADAADPASTPTSPVM